MKLWIIVIVVAVLAIGGWLLFTGGDQQTPPGKGADAAAKVPDFSLKDYDGNTVTLSDFAGTPLVINSWAVWCPFCVDELPAFAEAQKEFGDQVVIISIDRAESLNTAKKYTDDLGVTNDFVFLLDPSDSFYQSIGGFSMPETIFVDRGGNIIHHKRGPMKLPEMRQKINDIL